MTWPRTGCFTPTELRHTEGNVNETMDTSEEFSSSSSDLTVVSSYGCGLHPYHDDSSNKSMKCPLHKHIRNKAWPTVSREIQKNPHQIGQLNRMGWSSLILAVYHEAPIAIIAEMLSLLSDTEKVALLSTPVPNGARLCLHFCARFSSNVETFRLLVEAYPLALVVPSSDGNRPLDRAIYYHKDTDILRYLEESTKKQIAFIDNIQLRKVILEACALQWNRRRRNSNNMMMMTTMMTQPNTHTALPILPVVDDKTKFVLDIYGYAKEREMIGMFWEILSYVGIPAGRKHHIVCPINEMDG